MAVSKDELSASKVFFPISIIALVIFILVGFQTTVIMGERQALRDVKRQQEKPLEQAKKVQAQVDALAVGTQKLAHQGNKNAEAIILRMKQLGITVSQPEPGSTPPAAMAAPDAMPPTTPAAP